MPDRFTAGEPAKSGAQPQAEPGHEAGRRQDLHATAAVPRTPAALLVAHYADRLREQIGLRDGESALLVTRGPGAGSTYRLSNEPVSLGRSTSATIVLDDVSVSRRHAEVWRDANAYRIVDLGSLNGTYVAGVSVEEAVLTHGQEIRIGRFNLLFLSMVPAAR